MDTYEIVKKFKYFRTTDVVDALDAVGRADLTLMDERVKPLWQGIRRGEKLSVAMRATGHGFPSMDLIERIAMLQGKSNFANVIEVAAQQFGEKVEGRIRRASVILGTVFTLFILAVGLMINESVNSLMSDVARAVGF